MVLAVIAAFTVASLLVTLLCCGSALFWTGIHGPPRDNHPHCAACGYDLAGRSRPPKVCSECGADLQHWRAFQLAPRRINLKPIGYGLVLILSGFGPIVATVMAERVTLTTLCEGIARMSVNHHMEFGTDMHTDANAIVDIPGGSRSTIELVQRTGSFKLESVKTQDGK